MCRINHILLITITCNLYLISWTNALIGPDVRRAGANEFNFVASLSHKNRNCIKESEENHFCGGVLITKRHILTAAHCKSLNKKINDIRVKIGLIDLRKATSKNKYSIKKWTTFEEWLMKNNVSAPHLSDDISIIELSRSVDSSIKPAILANHTESDYDGETVVTAGWGRTNDFVNPRYLLAASLKVINRQKCIENMNRVDIKNKRHHLSIGIMCTNAEPYVILGCGDSGGPLLINGNEVIAINEATCPVQGEEHVHLEQNGHVRLDYYENFIQAVINEEKSNCWPFHRH